MVMAFMPNCFADGKPHQQQFFHESQQLYKSLIHKD
jgi:hypothetical protein